MNTAGARGWKSDQLVTAISGDYRLAQLDFVGFEVACGQDTAVLLHPFCRRLCEWPAIKPINPMFCNLTVRKRQVRLPEKVAFVQRVASFEEHLARGSEPREVILH